METAKYDSTRIWKRHDHMTPWGVCRECGLRVGEGISTDWDEVYHAGDPNVCPRCGGEMGIDKEA